MNRPMQKKTSFEHAFDVSRNSWLRDYSHVNRKSRWIRAFVCICPDCSTGHKRPNTQKHEWERMDALKLRDFDTKREKRIEILDAGPDWHENKMMSTRRKRRHMDKMYQTKNWSIQKKESEREREMNEQELSEEQMARCDREWSRRTASWKWRAEDNRPITDSLWSGQKRLIESHFKITT